MSEHFKSQITIDALKDFDIKKAIYVIITVSVVAFGFLVWLLYFKSTADYTPDFVYMLPGVNATFNSIATLFIILGFWMIKARNFKRHMQFMLTAFVFSAFFLVSYVIYHNFVGHTPFPGEGAIRPVYFTILISHIVLSAAVVPLVLSSFYFAFAGKFITHRKVSKLTFPIWLYVSVTGVVIYIILNMYVN